MRHSKIIFPIFLIIFLTIIVVIVLINHGRLSGKNEADFRYFKLDKWYGETIKYIENNKGKLPPSLYEVAVVDDEVFHYLQVCVPQTIDFSHIHDQLLDREFFENICEYQILKGENEWYIVEKKPGKYNKRRFLIDSNGNIYHIDLVKSHTAHLSLGT